MIIRSLSIQSHDKLGAAVFKLMIIFVCCIQTQLIVFMPNAAKVVDEGWECWGRGWERGVKNGTKIKKPRREPAGR